MNILNEVRAEAGRDLDMLAEVTKTNLGCDMVFISISKHDELYSVGLDQNSAQVPANRFRKELDTVCSATVGKNKTIVLEDALNHPAYKSLPYVSDGPIGAYLGVPLRTQQTGLSVLYVRFPRKPASGTHSRVHSWSTLLLSYPR